ncbi:MAG: hypothetical protein C0518_00155 [Opitutus sp.]|nr:hypothetical protein [Opitutus sp.]
MSRPFRRLSALLAAGVWLLLAAGCVTRPAGSSGDRGTVFSPTDKTETLPAQLVSNFFLIESRQADGRVRRFMVDTGSSVSYVSAELARAIALRERPGRTVRVESANGGFMTLPAATLRRLQLDGVTFERVPAAVFDFTELSTHLGVKIDGLIAFPVFRDHLVTFDYPNARLVIAPQPVAAAPVIKTDPRVTTLAFNNEQRVPFIPVQMGNESFVVLIDTGSDGALSLNATGLHPRFQFGPRTGTVVSSLAGDREQLVGRLEQDVLIGGHTIARPIVDLTHHVSAIGGELLRHFTVTFDQRRNYVTLAREAEGAVVMESRRSTGLALARSPIYWRVLTVVPDTPTSQLGVQPGELVVRINGEPVDQWTYERFAKLLASAAKVTFTFLAGTREFDREIPVFDLVP